MVCIYIYIFVYHTNQPFMLDTYACPMGIRHGDGVTSLLRQEHIIDPLVRRKILLEAAVGLHGGNWMGIELGKSLVAQKWTYNFAYSKHLEISLSLINQPCMYFIFGPTLVKNKFFGVTSKKTFAVEGKAIVAKKYYSMSDQIALGGSIVTRVSLLS